MLCQRKENRAGNTCPVFLMKGVNHPNHYFIDALVLRGMEGKDTWFEFKPILWLSWRQ